jgi:Phage protein Gp138 N-terminal domain
MTTDAEFQQDQQDLASEPTDLLASTIRDALMSVHTATVGIVKSYNAVQQTVKVQPAIKRVTKDGRSMAIPVCPDVPVVFFGGAVTFDISQGDECLLIFAERCIDRWWASGGVQEPAELRFHDLSDGFAILGVNSLPKLLSGIGSGTELRTRSGSVRIALRDGKVLLGASTASGAELNPLLHGVCIAQATEVCTELPIWMLGWTSSNVLAKP